MAQEAEKLINELMREHRVHIGQGWPEFKGVVESGKAAYAELPSCSAQRALKYR